MTKTLAILFVLLGGAALTLARRHKNQDPEAGFGTAGWTVIIALLVAIL